MRKIFKIPDDYSSKNNFATSVNPSDTKLLIAHTYYLHIFTCTDHDQRVKNGNHKELMTIKEMQ